MRCRRRQLNCIALCVIVSLLAKSVPAQVLRLTITDSASTVGVSGAIVSLLGADGQTRAVQVTNRAGFIKLEPDTADASGQYRLLVRKIGFKPWRSELYRVRAADTLSMQLAVPLVRVTLATIVVTGRTCGAPDANSDLLAAWEQAKTALDLAVRAESIPELDLRVQSFTRDKYRGSPVRELRSMVAPALGKSFVALPTDLLDRFGYLQPADDRGGLYFFAPDVPTLLSKQFEVSHCFQLSPTRNRRDTTLAIEFRPVDTRNVPEIAGELRLNRKTSALISVTYRYVQIPEKYPVDNARGMVNFQVQKDGWAYVREWAILYPLWYLKGKPENEVYGIEGSRAVGGAAWPTGLSGPKNFKTP